MPGGSAGSPGSASLPCQRRGLSPPTAASASSPSAAASARSYPGSAPQAGDRRARRHVRAPARARHARTSQPTKRRGRRRAGSPRSRVARRRRPALFGVDPRALRLRPAPARRPSPCASALVARRGLFAAVAERFELLGELCALLLGARELRLRRFQRRLGDAAFGAHRRLAREQLGERGLGLARSRLGLAEFGGDRGAECASASVEPLLDRRALLRRAGRSRPPRRACSASSRAMSPVSAASSRSSSASRRATVRAAPARRPAGAPAHGPASRSSASALRRSASASVAPVLRRLRLGDRLLDRARPLRSAARASAFAASAARSASTPARVEQPRLDARGSGR